MAIRAWTKLSLLTFTFQHVKGHQTDHVSYSQLDWWESATRMLVQWPRSFFNYIQRDHLLTEDLMFSQHSISKNRHSRGTALNSPASAEICYTPTSCTNSRTLAFWAEKDNLPCLSSLLHHRIDPLLPKITVLPKKKNLQLLSDFWRTSSKARLNYTQCDHQQPPTTNPVHRAVTLGHSSHLFYPLLNTSVLF